MCGIAGILAPGWEDAKVKAFLGPMLNAIRHRGPDDEGLSVSAGVGVGMRRLSIIDLSGGHQPMFSPDRGVALVFNGEIYNFRLLRIELEALGHVFTTNSDSEVLLYGYLQWGRDVLHRLNGMFAFAIHDSHKGKVLIARDHFGIKPLYFTKGNGLFAFCSEPAPLLEVPGVSRTLDTQALANFLAYKYVPAPRSFIQGVGKLQAGSFLELDVKSLDGEPMRYWTLGEKEGRTEVEDLEAEFSRSVRDQLVSDVPLGVFLSGGIDSGLLAWAASRAADKNFSGGYTVGFEDKSFDESDLAAKSAAYLGIAHRSTNLPLPAASELDDWVRSFQEPFANLSIPANFLICSWAAKSLKVMLNGSGADELFGGYDRYYAVHPPAVLRLVNCLSAVIQPLFTMLSAGSSKRSLVHRGRRYLAGCGLPPEQKHENSVRLFLDEERLAVAPGVGAADPILLETFAKAPGRDMLHKAMWTDMNTMMPDDYLTLVDRTSMSASLEVRVPFLDVEFAEYAFSLDAKHKVESWAKKKALRQLAQKALPECIINKPKMGFESPVGAWFRSNLGDTLVSLAERSRFASLFDQQALGDLVRAHTALKVDASKQLLGLYTLFKWGELYGIDL